MLCGCSKLGNPPPCSAAFRLKNQWHRPGTPPSLREAFQHLKMSKHSLNPHPFHTEHSPQGLGSSESGLIVTSPLEMQQTAVNLIVKWQNDHTDSSIRAPAMWVGGVGVLL